MSADGRFRARDHLGRLKDFQRRTVRHVVQRLYDDGEDCSRRFLVADETGLGKSVVARGVVAEALERLLADDTTERIDVVYVCSNSDIARQNLVRLDVTGGSHVRLDTRLTMLALHGQQLRDADTRWGKPINVVAFTPGTSFARGWATGQAPERALLAVLLEESLEPSARERTALHRILQGGITSLDRFREHIHRIDPDELDWTIAEQFAEGISITGLLDDVRGLVDELGQRRSLPDDLTLPVRELIGRLRDQLARASVAALEPDLVILDEFQRFRHLLDRENGGEAAELAHSMFEWDQARTLLLSATPYKPFTLHAESEQGEDHHTDFLATLDFLSGGDAPWLAEVRRGLAEHRSALLARDPAADDVARRLRELLLRVMCRTERPVVDGAHREVVEPLSVTATDLVDAVGLRRLAQAVDAPLTLDYWKSSPYFANFLDGYQLGRKLHDALNEGATSEVAAAVEVVATLDTWKLRTFSEVDAGNPRSRALAARTVGAEWWRLLWLPPSMPYLEPGGVFSDELAQDVTKQLVFSSWSATPTAIAGLLSYEATRRAVAGSGRTLRNLPQDRRLTARGLEYNISDGRAGAMSTLALFWPHPGLARLADPLEAARETPDAPRRGDDFLAWVTARLQADAEAEGGLADTDDGEGAVRAFFAWPADTPSQVRRMALETLTVRDASPELSEEGWVTGDPGDTAAEHDSGLAIHVDTALSTEPARRPSEALARLAAFSPANTAWRAVRRLVRPGDAVDDADVWHAAAVLASSLRSLFNRFESVLLLEALHPDVPRWQAVLAYCEDGNLQAVIDEHLHTQRSAQGGTALTGETLRQLVEDAAAPLTMRPSTYRAFDPHQPSERVPLPSRFALRYGAARGEKDDPRSPEVRQAFNSPFWPFVLATTSAGQEGIDFHWWCHSVVHWNTPSNPVDFEQREGRVNRFGGHAVRRNIARRHRADALHSDEQDPWKAVYDAAAAASAAETDLGDFCPFWVYPGPHAVQRRLMPYPLSIDGPRTETLKRSLAHYRLALGQPRQEDLLAALGGGGPLGTPLDLRPPDSGDDEAGGGSDVAVAQPAPAASHLAPLPPRGSETTTTSTVGTWNHDLTKYVVTDASGQSTRPLAKRRAILALAHALVDAGVTAAQVAAALPGRKVRHLRGTTIHDDVLAKFREVFPQTTSPERWFTEEPLPADDGVYVITKMFGDDSEAVMTQLVGLAPPGTVRFAAQRE